MAEFIEGITIKAPHEKAPAFVLGKVSFNVEKLIAFLRANQNESGWVNADLKKSDKNGAIYLQLDTYKKESSGPPR